MSAQLNIRPIAPSDIEPVADLLAALATEFIIGKFAPEAQQRFLANNNAAAIRDLIACGYRYHVAELNGEVAGFAGVRDNKHLYHLFVEKSAQQCGLGRRLWHFAKHDCLNNGHRAVFTVNASDNAVQFYERLGFLRDGVAQNANGVLYNPMRLQADVEQHDLVRSLRPIDPLIAVLTIL